MAKELPEITYGALSKILNGERGFEPTLTVLSLKKSKPSKRCQKQASVMLGDGDMYLPAIISPGMQKGIRSSSVVTLKKFLCQDVSDQKVICILDLKCYSTESEKPLPPPIAKVQVEEQIPAVIHRQASKLSKDDDDNTIPPKLHRGTSFGTGSRESLFSSGSAQERELVRELVAASTFYHREEDFPAFIQKTRSAGFYRPATHVQIEPSMESETQSEQSEEEDVKLLEKIRRTVSAGSGHFRGFSSKFIFTVLAEKQKKEPNTNIHTTNTTTNTHTTNTHTTNTHTTKKQQQKKESFDNEDPPRPPSIDDVDLSKTEKQVVVMRELHDDPRGFTRSLSRPWLAVKSLSFTKKSTTSKQPKKTEPEPAKKKKTFRSIVGLGGEKKKPKQSLTRSLSAIFHRK